LFTAVDQGWAAVDLVTPFVVAPNVIPGTSYIVSPNGAQHGDVLYFDGTIWKTRPGTFTGYVLTTNGVGADPAAVVAHAGVHVGRDVLGKRRVSVGPHHIGRHHVGQVGAPTD
jgi:hypothetical protein